MKTWPLLLTLTLLVWCMVGSEAKDDSKSEDSKKATKGAFGSLWSKIKAKGKEVWGKIKKFGSVFMTGISKKAEQLLDKKDKRNIETREARNSFASERHG